MFCDVVAKNGNLLIGVGPRPDGTIPEVQQAPLRGLGAWLERQRRGHLRQPALGGDRVGHDGRDPAALHQERRGRLRAGAGHAAAARQITMRAVDGARVRRVRLVGADAQLEWSVERGGDLSVTLPEQLPLAAVTVLDLGTGVRARLGLTR